MSLKGNIFYILVLLLFFEAVPVEGQKHAGILYGEVTMADGKKHEGVIQWSSHELNWDDIFTATKQENKVLKYLSGDEIKRLSEEEKAEKIDWGFMRLWENRYPAKKHSFECQFGYIQTITITGEQSAVVTLKNGKNVEVSGREDTGRNIYMLDKQGRRSKLEWARLQSVTFKNTPDSIFVSSIIPLYGTVTTDTGDLTGFIQWDMDESLNVHYLDGKLADGQKKAIQFEQIREIEKIAENTSRITLVSGEKLDLSDTDDVGRTNNGIMVKDTETGNIRVGWHNFQKVTFTTTVPQAPAYQDYRKPVSLTGKITRTDQATLEGKFIFDLDESMDIELLKGRSKGLHYYVPFSNIQSIERINHKYTTLTLKNGSELTLTGTNDVTDKNWGILILNGKEKPQYVPWIKIDYITLNQLSN